MSTEEKQPPAEEAEPAGRPWWLYAAGAAGVLVVLIVTAYAVVGPKGRGRDTGSGGPEGDGGLEAARAMLVKETDLKTCRSALEQVNAHRAVTGEALPALPAEEAARLKERFGLNDAALAEVSAGTFTLLDGHHLDACFLTRDLLDVIEAPAADKPGGKPAAWASLDLAAAAFARVVREVRQDDALVVPVPGQESVVVRAPPAFTARRGMGSALERAFLFLALLDQFGATTPDGVAKPRATGCLLLCPGADGRPRFWACGVAVDDDPELYVFDPRLGLPLPGPGGEGIATLSALRKDGKLLDQLTVDAKQPYDVTAEQVQKAEILYYAPLSALAPRMRHLQEKVLAPAVRGHVFLDGPARAERLAKAAEHAGGVPLKPWDEAATLLRDFLPAEEGGTDKVLPFQLALLRGFTDPGDPAIVGMQRKHLYEMLLTPWAELPDLFRDNRKFPYRVGLGERVRTGYAHRFLASALEPGGTRDLMLRGRFADAVKSLSAEREDHRNAEEAFRKAVGGPDGGPALRREIDAWVEKAVPAYAALQRAGTDAAAKSAAARQVEALWRFPEGRPVALLLNDAVAKSRGPEVTYLIARNKHEIAEQAQARLDLPARAGGGPARPAAEWADAVTWWQKYEDEFPGGPQRADARRQFARALAAAGEARRAAAKLEVLSDEMMAPEKVAALFAAARLKRKHAAD